MDFNILSEYFEKIKRTSSRLEMTAILADLFKQIAVMSNSDENLRCAVYFTQGRINSEISEDPKLGVAEKQLISILTEKVDKNIEDIKKIVKKKGDVGVAAQELIEAQYKKGGNLGAFLSKSLEPRSDDPNEGSEKKEKVSKEQSERSSNENKIGIVDQKKTQSKEKKKKDLFGFALQASDNTQKELKNSEPFIQSNNHLGTKEVSTLEEKIPRESTKSGNNFISINEIHKELDKISKISGENSTRDKSNLILGLINKLDSVAVKYLFNIINGTLRTGVSSMTIIDGLAVAFTEKKELREVIERGYYLYPDLGEIAVILKNKGIQGIREMKITIGIPIKMMLASRVSYKEIPKKMGIPFYAEYKYDGERVQVHKKGSKITLFSRHLKNISEMYPDVIDTVSKQIPLEEIVFEGEIVAMDAFYEKMLPFQMVSLRRRKYNVEEMVKKVKVTLFAFDLLYFNKSSDPSTAVMVMDLALEQRRKYLKELIKESEQLRISDGKYIHSLEEMVEYFKKSREEGAEGIMNKSLAPEARYCPGNRGFYWIKLKGLEAGKLMDTLDVVIIGASFGQGKRAGKLSGILCAVYNEETEKFESLTNLGSGFDEETLEMLTVKLLKMKLDKKPTNVESKDAPDIWVTPEIIIEISCDEITLSQTAIAGASLNNGQGFSLRFPVFQRFREDKGVKEITTSVEIKQFYESQK